MIIHHGSWGMNNIRHNCKTVREFIDKELMQIEGKENKYFRICTKKAYDKKQNMLLYFQDGKLKSHHSTQLEFNYEDVLDYEIFEFYSMDDLKVTNIVSVQDDCLEDLKKRLDKDSGGAITFNLDTLGMSEDEKFIYHINKACENAEVKNIVKSSAYIEDKIVAKALRMLFKETDKIIGLNNRIKELEKLVEQQSQQIKWLGKTK